jgi:CRP-like cAMP-binding protein
MAGPQNLHALRPEDGGRKPALRRPERVSSASCPLKRADAGDAQVSAMADSARFAFHRPEYAAALQQGDSKLATLMGGARQTIKAGATLIEAGSDHPFIYRLVEGWLGRSRELPDARRQFILMFLPGDLFGVKSMFMSRHPDAVRAISDARVERIHYQALHDAYAADSDVASRCLWQIMEEERRLHSWVVSLGQGTAEERLARLLVDFRGRLILSGTIPADTLQYELPLTQVQIADHLGLTSVHVNRVLKSLRDQGIVAVRDGSVAIGDLAGLVRRASAMLDPYELQTSAYVGAAHRPRAGGSR